MDAQTEQVATDVLDAMTEAREMFTAYDVTSQLRQQGHQVTHYSAGGVREFVHSHFLDVSVFPADYTRSLHDFGKGSTFVFHPQGEDVNDYDPSKWQPVGDQDDDDEDDDTVVTAPAPAPAPVDDDGKIGVDARGRLCVRASFVRQLGLKPGDEVIVHLDTCEIWKYSSYKSSLNSKPFTVDKSNCIRIGAKTLEEMFSPPSRSLRFELEFDSLGFVKVKV